MSTIQTEDNISMMDDGEKDEQKTVISKTPTS